ncbi:hypothetical protein GWG65_03485 [Bradyrhizobium sp. CSA207]|uniref:hypothetical protein n=1 Tax=Bradyrhizobium sp. CSA207 TaxID=2698826 RepID=UPI0023AE72E6|nr:hypothetical protein [Bradyrhizobium sp. CSA207]MDE5440526.1 hypothetical protein [Bradyrhizobium sp. CSA207]
MAKTIYQYPGGVPRYYIASQASIATTDDVSEKKEELRDAITRSVSKAERDALLSKLSKLDDGIVEVDVIHECGTACPAFYVLNDVVHDYNSGAATYWIDDGMPARYLHPYDGSLPSLYLCED